MNDKIEYPLAQVLEVKRRRVDEAERLVKERQAELEKQQKILREREAARDEVENHRQDKLTQLRETLDTGTTSPEVQQMKRYLEVVDERLQAAQASVDEQIPQVEQAERHLQEAKALLAERRKEVQKLEEHEKIWLKEARKEAAIAEQRRQDELGTTIHISKRRNDDDV